MAEFSEGSFPRSAMRADLMATTTNSRRRNRAAQAHESTAAVRPALLQCRTRGNSMTNLAGVVRLLKKEQDRLTKELRGIGAALAAFGKTYGKGTRARKLSASARARIAAAQRARWANVREAAKVVPIRAKP